jgi:antitoxin component of MazEF toxin-antitoxin module
MLNAALRRSGGSLILAIPQAYIEQNHLEAGSHLVIEITGEELKLRPARRRLGLAELLAATPEGLNRVENWEDMMPAGEEI